jgi:DNA-binding XRE family transcriptional regulator
MQALVKTPRTNIHIKGEIPSHILEMLRKEYGGDLKIYEGDEEYVEVTESDWYKETAEITTPGDAMRIYRKNHQLTQEELGKKLGNVPRQIVSNMERGKRSISLATAKKLSVIFNVPASRFLDL